MCRPNFRPQSGPQPPPCEKANRPWRRPVDEADRVVTLLREIRERTNPEQSRRVPPEAGNPRGLGSVSPGQLGTPRAERQYRACPGGGGCWYPTRVRQSTSVDSRPCAGWLAGGVPGLLRHCGAGPAGRRGYRALLARLRDLASDPRWRVREGVVMALQRRPMRAGRSWSVRCPATTRTSDGS